MFATILTAALTAVVTAIGTFALIRTWSALTAAPEYKAEAVAQKLLSHPVWQWRSFRILRQHLGGYGDDELRRILVQAGAVRFETVIGEEIWGLYDRVRPSLESKRYPIIGKAFTVLDEVALTPEVTREIRILVAEGRKSVATTRIREVTGLGVTQSEALLEKL